VLHYLNEPAAALREAARLVEPGGRLLIIDFAPHTLEYLREQHQHRRLGFSDAEIGRWLEEAGLSAVQTQALPPARDGGLTVKIWSAERAPLQERHAA
jgi:ArsR family transcriptional regulator